MNGWRANYIRAFIAIIGFALILIGATLGNLVDGSVIGIIFIIIGAAIILFVGYWWYKTYQKGE